MSCSHATPGRLFRRSPPDGDLPELLLVVGGLPRGGDQPLAAARADRVVAVVLAVVRVGNRQQVLVRGSAPQVDLAPGAPGGDDAAVGAVGVPRVGLPRRGLLLLPPGGGRGGVVSGRAVPRGRRRAR